MASQNGQPSYREPRPLLEALPDISVRFAVGSFTTEGGISFGPAKVTAAGQVYRAVLDYVNVDVVPVPFLIGKVVQTSDSATIHGPLSMPTDRSRRLIAYEAFGPASQADAAVAERRKNGSLDEVTIPVYVGIGMRLSADVRALKGNVALTSLGAIAAAAQAEALTGTLTVQTLGISGRSVATVLPLPSKLDPTTVENGILALGSSRTVLYGTGDQAGDVVRTPRVVGLYSPIGSDPRLINAIYSELSRERPPLMRFCSPVAAAPVATDQATERQPPLP